MSVITTRDQMTQITRGGGPLARPQAGPPRQSKSSITGKDIVRALRKRILLVAFCLALFTAVSIVGTYFWRLYAPTYRAQAMMEVTPPKGMFDPKIFSNAYGNEAGLITQSYMKRVRTEKVIEDVLKAPEVRATAWFKEIGSRAKYVLPEELGVRELPDTSNLFYIYMDGRDPKEMVVIVNAVAETFEEISNKAARRSQLENISRLDESRKLQESELTRLRNSLSDLTKRLSTSDQSVLKRQIAETDERLGRLKEMISTLTEQHSSAKTQLGELQTQMGDGTIVDNPMIKGQIAGDPRLQQLQQQYDQLRNNLAVMTPEFDESHPHIKAMKRQIDSLGRTMESYRQSLTENVVSFVTGSIEREEKRLADELQAAQAAYRLAEERLAEHNQALNTLMEERGKIKQVSQRINLVEDKMFEIRASLESIRPIRVASEASEPEKPSSPKFAVMVTLGVMLGLGIGVGLALLLEFVDTSVKTPADITQRIDLPMLGVVPHTRDLDEDIEDPHRAFMTNPNSLIGESFRQIRTCLLFSGPAGQTKSILVTSPQPGDGRGTVTVNLAAAVAHGGKRVLVVDANFRQPMIRRVFEGCPESGLSNALVGQGDWREYVHEVEPNLHVMSSGPMPPNPAELLGSDHMRNLLAEMGTQYDQVIFDGAPVLLVTDAPILSTIVDGTILVVRAGANTYGIVQRASGTLNRVGAHVLGVILNGIRVTAGGYLRENYRTFYEYHEQP